LSGWTFSTDDGGTATWDGTDGDPSPGSVILSSSSPGTTMLTQCVRLSGPTNYLLGLRFKPAAVYTGTVPGGNFQVIVYSYASTDCSGTGTLGTTLFSVQSPASWNDGGAVENLSGQSASVNLTLINDGSSNRTYNVDHLSLSNSTPVRLQSFSVD